MGFKVIIQEILLQAQGTMFTKKDHVDILKDNLKKSAASQASGPAGYPMHISKLV